MSKPYFEAVHEMDDDRDFYKAALGITRSIPSEETLHQRMDDIGDSLRQTILEQNVEMLLANKIQPTPLANGLVPDIEVETWWTNLGDPDEEIIRLYHAHGECEQFHSEVKLIWSWSGFHPESLRPMHGYSNWG